MRANNIPSEISSYLLNIQHRLFDIGAELAIPGNAIISPESVDKLEELIDNFNADLPSLKEFILPGGSLSASICHLNAETLRYINRLSDLLFVFARTLNQKEGDKEVLWDSERLKRSV